MKAVNPMKDDVRTKQPFTGEEVNSIVGKADGMSKGMHARKTIGSHEDNFEMGKRGGKEFHMEAANRDISK